MYQSFFSNKDIMCWCRSESMFLCFLHSLDSLCFIVFLSVFLYFSILSSIKFISFWSLLIVPRNASPSNNTYQDFLLGHLNMSVKRILHNFIKQCHYVVAIATFRRREWACCTSPVLLHNCIRTNSFFILALHRALTQKCKRLHAVQTKSLDRKSSFYSLVYNIFLHAGWFLSL